MKPQIQNYTTIRSSTTLAAYSSPTQRLHSGRIQKRPFSLAKVCAKVVEAARKSSNACFDAQSVVVEWQPLLLPAAALV